MITPRHNAPPLGTVLCILLVAALIGLLGTPIQAQDDTTLVDTLVDTTELSVLPPAPAPPSTVTAYDAPDDDGSAIIIKWSASLDEEDAALNDTVLVVGGYVVESSESPEGPWETVEDKTTGATRASDGGIIEGQSYYYRVGAYRAYISEAGEKLRSINYSEVVGPVASSAQWFFMGRIWVLLWALIISFGIIFFIQKAKKGEELYVRKIAGIDAVDEAVGRATEMGKKIFYIPGIMDMNDVQTIAGIAILGRVAKLAAQYETWLEVPVSKSLVMVTARETMKEAYSEVGRPDNFQDAQVHYLTDDQFGYAAAIDGMVVRERPATIFYMGAFFAESLILAETGNAAGAIQIAGTAMPSQLPFFVAACDYTLIGEELFAASAYLSREPRQLGSLKGQDLGKGLFLLFIVLGVIWATVGLADITGFDFSSIFSTA